MTRLSIFRFVFATAASLCLPLAAPPAVAAQEAAADEMRLPAPDVLEAPAARQLRVGQPMGAVNLGDRARGLTLGDVQEEPTEDGEDWGAEPSDPQPVGEAELDEELAAEDEAWLAGELDEVDEGAEAGAEQAEGAEPPHHGDSEHGDSEHGDSDHGEGGHGPAAGHGADGHHAAHFDAKEFAYSCLNFLVWFGIIFFLLRKPLTTHLRDRRREVEEGLVEAARLEREAQEKHAEYSDRLSRLDEELAKLRQEMVDAGEAEANRIIAEAEARAARMRKDAQFAIDQRMKQLRTDLTREAIEAAIEAAERVLSEQVGQRDQLQLAQSYLKDLSEAIEREEPRA